MGKNCPKKYGFHYDDSYFFGNNKGIPRYNESVVFYMEKQKHNHNKPGEPLDYHPGIHFLLGDFASVMEK